MPKAEKKSVKRKFNIAAIIAAFFILMSGFLFQIFNFEFLGREWQIERAVMFNLVMELGDLDLPGNLETVVISMVIVYFAVLILFILNGFAVLPDKFSFIASVLTLLYLFLGLYFVPTFNDSISIPIFGNVGEASLGLGTYLIPLIAAFYLLLKKPINEHVNI